jgi:hypothetical protein
MSVTVTTTTSTPEQLYASFGLPMPPRSESEPAPAETEFAHSIQVEADAVAVPLAEPVAEEPAPEPVPEEPKPVEVEAEAEDEETEPVVEPPKPGEPRKVSRAQQRVNDALREKYLAEGRAAQLQAELDALKAPKPPVAEPPHDTPAVPSDSDPRPEEDAFADWSEYQLKLAEWAGRQAARALIAEERQKDADKAAKAAAEKSAAEAKTARQQAFDTYQSRAAEARKVYADFDAVVGQDIPLDEGGIMQAVIVTSEVGPELAYYLGQNPEVCAALAAADRGTLLTRMHRLEGRLEAQREVSARPAPTAVSRIPHAPPPPPAVRVGSSVQLPTTRTARTFKEFEEAEARERAARAKTR